MAGSAACRRGAEPRRFSQAKKDRLDAEFDESMAEIQAASQLMTMQSWLPWWRGSRSREEILCLILPP